MISARLPGPDYSPPVYAKKVKLAAVHRSRIQRSFEQSSLDKENRNVNYTYDERTPVVCKGKKLLLPPIQRSPSLGRPLVSYKAPYRVRRNNALRPAYRQLKKLL